MAAARALVLKPSSPVDWPFVADIANHLGPDFWKGLVIGVFLSLAVQLVIGTILKLCGAIHASLVSFRRSPTAPPPSPPPSASPASHIPSWSPSLDASWSQPAPVDVSSPIPEMPTPTLASAPSRLPRHWVFKPGSIKIAQSVMQTAGRIPDGEYVMHTQLCSAARASNYLINFK